MKIAIIIPKNAVEQKPSFYSYSFYKSFLFTNKHFSYMLAAPVLTSLTPAEHEVRVFDENIERIDYDWPADLAGITVRTMFANRAYDISRRYRALGVKTVLGGIHPSMCPEDALEHCDAVVQGEAESTWPQLLEDLEKGRLERIYRADCQTEMTSQVDPDRAKLERGRYFADIVQTTKGCPFDCEFCSVSVFDGRKLRHKDVSQVVSEIETILSDDNQYKKKSIFFADDNIIADRDYARDLFTALTPYNLNWSCQGSINISKDSDLLSLMKSAGCGAILVGLESISSRNLEAMGKNVNLRHDYLSAIETIQNHGIMVHGSFILGYDFDTVDSFDELIEFINEAELLMPLINVLTPLPGTKLYKRFEDEGRLLHKNWDDYDGQTVVYTPRGMTPEELQDGFRKVIRNVYSFERIYRILDQYWQNDYWRNSNLRDPIKLKYRTLFALRLVSLLPNSSRKRRWFIMKILPRVFEARVRISTIITMMAYNDYAYKS